MTTSTHGGARRGNKATNKRQQQQKLKSGKPKSHRHYKLMAQSQKQRGGVAPNDENPLTDGTFELVEVGPTGIVTSPKKESATPQELLLEPITASLTETRHHNIGNNTKSPKVPPPRRTPAKPSELQQSVPPHRPPKRGQASVLPPSHKKTQGTPQLHRTPMKEKKKQSIGNWMTTEHQQEEQEEEQEEEPQEEKLSEAEGPQEEGTELQEVMSLYAKPIKKSTKEIIKILTNANVVSNLYLVRFEDAYYLAQWDSDKNTCESKKLFDISNIYNVDKASFGGNIALKKKQLTVIRLNNQQIKIYYRADDSRNELLFNPVKETTVLTEVNNLFEIPTFVKYDFTFIPGKEAVENKTKMSQQTNQAQLAAQQEQAAMNKPLPPSPPPPPPTAPKSLGAIQGQVPIATQEIVFNLIAQQTIDTDQKAVSSEIAKNDREPNIRPYKYRQLSVFQLEKGYINASPITLTVGGINLSYIATQCPNENTRKQFWEMILFHKINVICMVTDFFGTSKKGTRMTKCMQYFPSNTEDEENEDTLIDIKQQLNLDGIIVSCTETKAHSNFPNIKIRSITVTKKRITHKMTHILYKAWPDHGYPDNHESVVALSNLINKYNSNAPPVIHCTAGVGRTGSIIAINYLMNCLASNTNLHKLPVISYKNFVSTIIYEMRAQRNSMVQGHIQYDGILNTVFKNTNTNTNEYAEAISNKKVWQLPQEYSTDFVSVLDKVKFVTHTDPPEMVEPFIIKNEETERQSQQQLQSSAALPRAQPPPVPTSARPSQPNFIIKHKTGDNSIYYELHTPTNVFSITSSNCDKSIKLSTDNQFCILNNILFTSTKYFDFNDGSSYKVDIGNLNYYNPDGLYEKHKIFLPDDYDNKSFETNDIGDAAIVKIKGQTYTIERTASSEFTITCMKTHAEKKKKAKLLKQAQKDAKLAAEDEKERRKTQKAKNKQEKYDESLEGQLKKLITQKFTNLEGKHLFVVKYKPKPNAKTKIYVVKLHNSEFKEKEITNITQNINSQNIFKQLLPNQISVFKNTLLSQKGDFFIIHKKDDGQNQLNQFSDSEPVIELNSNQYKKLKYVTNVVTRVIENFVRLENPYNMEKQPEFSEETSMAGGARTLKRNDNKSASATKHTRKRRQTTMAAKQRKLLLKTTMKRV